MSPLNWLLSLSRYRDLDGLELPDIPHDRRRFRIIDGEEVINEMLPRNWTMFPSDEDLAACYEHVNTARWRLQNAGSLFRDSRAVMLLVQFMIFVSVRMDRLTKAKEPVLVQEQPIQFGDPEAWEHPYRYTSPYAVAGEKAYQDANLIQAAASAIPRIGKIAVLPRVINEMKSKIPKDVSDVLRQVLQETSETKDRRK